MSSIKLIVHLTTKLNFCPYFLYFLTNPAGSQYKSPYTLSKSSCVFQTISAMEAWLYLGDVLYMHFYLVLSTFIVQLGKYWFKRSAYNSAQQMWFL
jgi:hypothetical protein